MEYGKIIGVGNTATVYELENNKVLKLFNRGYIKEYVEKEFHNVKVIAGMHFPKPRAYEIVCEERWGIIYDRIYGESLLDWAIRTGDIYSCAIYMENLHKLILRNTISDVSNYKEFLKDNILKAAVFNSIEVDNMLDKLPEGNTLCHGDFHPDNIFLLDGKTFVIDFMNVCKGTFLYDVARTVFLVEYTPVAAEIANREILMKYKKNLADLYLKQMKVTRAMIKDYLSVIIAARAGECPSEQLNLTSQVD